MRIISEHSVTNTYAHVCTSILSLKGKTKSLVYRTHFVLETSKHPEKCF